MLNQLLSRQGLYVLICMTIIVGCSKSSDSPPPADPCDGVTITVNGTSSPTSSAGTSTGSVTATASGASGFTYSINNGAFQSSGTFSNLAAGTYTVTAKSSQGCTGTGSFTVTDGDACAGKTITVTAVSTKSDQCGASGTITVTAAGSTGFTYRLNANGTYQPANVFNAVAAGNYTVYAKDAGGCEKTVAIKVETEPNGPKFSAVVDLINNKCVSCHGANNPAGVDFRTDCGIANRASQIKTQAVDLEAMPKGGPPLTASEKKVITDWIDAGGKSSD